jgi:hypothetical protein
MALGKMKGDYGVQPGSLTVGTSGWLGELLARAEQGWALPEKNKSLLSSPFPPSQLGWALLSKVLKSFLKLPRCSVLPCFRG